MPDDQGSDADTPTVKDLDEMEAAELDRRLNMLRISNEILNRNFEDLVEADEYYHDTPELWNRENSHYMQDFQIEYLRRLHNYISAYYSLYSHTQTLTNSIASEELDKAYTQKLDELDIEETSTFLLRFRAYTQHYELPAVQARVSLSGSDEGETDPRDVNRICFERDTLLEWDDWNTAEEYVRGFDETIDMLPLLKRITETVNEFHEWFVREVRSQHEMEYEEYLEKQEEVVERLKDLRGVSGGE
ncbi:hypothetical protein SAMN06266787_10848 [Halorubrum ezzemoulense]|uniref:Uncharacterized protein n=1 Tax=Halorubrum ezzemoulense TaxID=337243 RepID=A0A238Y518_HALEZ|nr:hypothetical protein [Halorubrum ezzemoulense]SNR65763.1 hypothetical protein SAMN06266787_10848 [Halorubrum ezzemoulense]